MITRRFRVPRFVVLASVLVALAASFVLFQGSSDGLLAQEPPIDPGPGTQYITPALWALLQRHADGDATVPATLDVRLSSTREHIAAVQQAITDVGGTAADGWWRLPTDRLLPIIQLPVVVRAEMPAGPAGQTGAPRAALNDTLQDIVRAYESGVPAAAAVQYALFVDSNHRMLMTIRASDAAADGKVRKWLGDRNIYTPLSKHAITGLYYTYTMLSLPNVVALADEVTTIRMAVEDFEGQGLPLSRAHWPQEARDFENAAIAAILRAEREGPRQPVEPTEPADAPGPDESAGPTGASHWGPPNGLWELDLTARREAHGVDRWYDFYLRGAGTKVGIIDWGFNGIFDDPVLGRGLTTTTDWNNLNARMFCQPEEHGTWPYGALTGMTSWNDCEPSVVNREIRHGVNVAELAHDLAPSAQFYYAQANSPRQVYRAADWLDRQDVDVIVHAAGWMYDGPGNGWSPFQEATYVANPDDAAGNEHSPYRYYPSPIYTVDKYVDSDGPVWVNAAGNQETLTMWATDLSLVGGTSEYANYVNFRPDIDGTSNSDYLDKTCQEVPKKAFTPYAYSMRWKDRWNDGEFDLEFHISHRIKNYDVILPATIVASWNKFADSAAVSQHGSGKFPVRRVTALSLVPSNEYCLRVEVQRAPTGKPVPNWIQFQIITNDHDSIVNWRKETNSGRSVVNPAGSANAGLLAVGAFDLRSSSADPPLKSYSSRGPVFTRNADLRTTPVPTRKKPDITAGTF